MACSRAVVRGFRPPRSMFNADSRDRVGGTKPDHAGGDAPTWDRVPHRFCCLARQAGAPLGGDGRGDLPRSWLLRHAGRMPLSWGELGAFAGLCLVLAATPGANLAVVLRCASPAGSAAVAATAGLTVGKAFWAALSLLGAGRPARGVGHGVPDGPAGRRGAWDFSSTVSPCTAARTSPPPMSLSPRPGRSMALLPPERPCDASALLSFRCRRQPGTRVVTPRCGSSATRRPRWLRRGRTSGLPGRDEPAEQRWPAGRAARRTRRRRPAGARWAAGPR